MRAAVKMLIAFILPLCIVGSSITMVKSGHHAWETNFNSSRRASRFFPVVSIVRFAKSQCRSTSGLLGICMSPAECTTGGDSSGSCASGYGVCCVYQMSCGGVTNKNGTYFVNPGYPSSTSAPQSCTIRVDKTSLNTQQLRIDLEIFNVNGLVSGVCNTDALIITGQNADSTIPAICGINDGQHVYVNVDAVPGPVALTVTTSGSGERRWRMRITQMERGNPLKAPRDCLQYFTGANGVLESFNFAATTPAQGTRPANQANYANNLNYALCIRREAGSCSIRYEAPTNSFSIEGPTDNGAIDSTCSNDYLIIPGGQNAPPTAAGAGSRFCGVFLSAAPSSSASNPVISNLAGPIQLTFVTNGQPPATFNRGFRINYQQLPCSATGRRRRQQAQNTPISLLNYMDPRGSSPLEYVHQHIYKTNC